MKNILKKSGLVLFWVVLGVLAVAWLLIPWFYLQSYCYRHPMIPDGGLFALALLRALLPLALTGAAAAFMLRKKRIAALVLWVAAVLVLPGTLLTTLGETLFQPTIWSHTDDPEDFGDFDKVFVQHLTPNPVGCFPAEIPPEAENVQYSYYYVYAAAEYVYVAVRWDFPTEADFDRYVAQLPPAESSALYENALFCDRESLSVGFVIAENENWLPKSLDNLIMTEDNFANLLYQ